MHRDPHTTSAEGEMEAQIARLESDVSHLRADMADVKSDIRAIRDKIDATNAHIVGVKDSLNANILA